MKTPFPTGMARRQFLAGGLATTLATSMGQAAMRLAPAKPKARIAITLDLEMSRHYPRRGMTEWDYQKGNLDAATKEYSVKAGQLVKKRGGILHYFCVGRVLELPTQRFVATDFTACWFRFYLWGGGTVARAVLY